MDGNFSELIGKRKNEKLEEKGLRCVYTLWRFPNMKSTEL